MREGRNAMKYHYEEWEDWQSGLYDPTYRPDVVAECVALLMSPEAFRMALMAVSVEWPKATAQHLSDVTQNHQPWCGRLACGYEAGATIREVNTAWFELGPAERMAANRVADDFTRAWRAGNMPGQTAMPI